MENIEDIENDDGQERRAKRQKTNHKSAIFEKLKQLKGKGSKNKYEVTQMEDVFTVVNEKEYSQSVMDRQADWIVDDDGSGYVEDGRDIFDDDLDAESISHASKSSNERRKKKNVSKAAAKGNIQALLSNMPEKKKESSKLDEDELLTDILAEIDDNASTSKISNTTFHQDISTKLEEERQVRAYMKTFSDPKPTKIKLKSTVIKKPKVVREKNTNDSHVNDAPLPEPMETDFHDNDNDDDDDDHHHNDCTNGDTSEQENSTINNEKDVQKSPVIKTPLDDDLFEGDFTIDDMEGSEILKDIPVAVEDVVEDFDTSLMFDEWFEENPPSFEEHFADEVKEQPALPQIPLCENEDKEKVFSFFWWDAYEDIQNQPGVIYLFGKTYIESTKTYASCCVTLKNVERKLYFLPRPFKLDKQGKETKEPVTMQDVHKEWVAFARENKIERHRSVKVNKKYAFDPEIPSESEYLEVRFDTNVHMPKDFKGKTFSRVFGLNNSFLELFLLDMKLKGPCWLEIKNPKCATNPVSWCKYEIDCPHQKLLKISKNTLKPPPPLVVATLNIRTVPNKHMKNEIVMICCAVQNNYCVDKPPPSQPFQQHFCVFTKSSLGTFPPNLHKALQGFKGTRVQKLDSERALLNYFLTSLEKIDPDLIVGHDFLDFHLSNLSARLLDGRVTRWSRIGKLKRSLIPVNTKKTKELMAGRLLCDLKVSAKELIKSRSYDLDTLCETVLKLKENERFILETGDVLKMLDNVDTILRLITLTMRDAGYITKMMYELNVIPLALQITKIAGNVMSQTLQGGRAQRNEFLLLHAFDERNYICPDKEYGKKDKESQDTTSKKKATYAGGLVLDPKIGFYDKLILLMDFNSLYPSIIQEFNICFTTMSADLDVEKMLRNAKREPGILPAEIRKLVECRREVKKLMSNSKLSNDLRVQYNIRQLALKLTANSMYGCLGFQYSRFFAKHLAALITMKGRDILMHTRDLVQSMGFEVIYGDTDSIMINTHSTKYEEAMQYGKKIKQTINKFYKQVELDVDGVFKYMLLLKKKKYAALTMSINKDGKTVLEQEHKGLDIVRRDWSMLASQAGKVVLTEIFCEENSFDKRIENIINKLKKIGSDVRDGTVPPGMFILTKQLTKNIDGYKDKSSLSHVLVAERYNKRGGKPLVAGDTVPYVICEDGTTNSSTQRAYHVEEVKQAKGTLKIDINYYLMHQVHPVVSRLCEPLEALDACQIANALGIDSSAFTVSKPKPNEDSLLAVVPIKNYAKAEYFEFKCFGCKETNVVNKLVMNKVFWLEKCSNEQCTVKPLEYLPAIQNKLVLDIRKYVDKYYQRILICEDPICPNETDCVPQKFVGKYPVCDVCDAGLMYSKYTARDLYEQLCFFKYLCDVSKVPKRNISPRLETAYKKLTANVDKFLRKSLYGTIDVTALFLNIFGEPGTGGMKSDYIYEEVDEELD